MLHLEHLSLTTCTSLDEVTTFLSEDGVKLIDPLEHIDWTHNPVQLILCSCGVEGCTRDQYIHLSRLGNFALWTHPVEDADADEVTMRSPHRAIHAHGAVCIERAMWTYLGSAHPNVPAFEALAPLTYEALLCAWLQPILIQGRGTPRPWLPHALAEQILSCDTLDNAWASEWVRHHITRLMEDPKRAVEGQLVPVSAHRAQVEMLYLGRPSWVDVPLFALHHDAMRLLIGRDWMLLED